MRFVRNTFIFVSLKLITNTALLLFIDSRGIGGEIVGVDAEPGDTVGDLMQSNGLEQSKWSFGGTLLDDPSLPLSDTGLSSECTLQVTELNEVSLATEIVVCSASYGSHPETIVKTLTVNRDTMVKDLVTYFDDHVDGVSIWHTENTVPLTEIVFTHGAGGVLPYRIGDDLTDVSPITSFSVPDPFCLQLQRLPIFGDAAIEDYYERIRSLQHREEIPGFLRDEGPGAFITLSEEGHGEDFIVREESFQEFSMNDVWQSMNVMGGGAEFRITTYQPFQDEDDSDHDPRSYVATMFVTIPPEYDVVVQQKQPRSARSVLIN